MKRIVNVTLALLFIGACSGTARDCSSCAASEFGADWIIVQYTNDGHPINCWQLHDEAVSNEEHTDGIFWKSEGHLVHISGWYNRVQVDDGNYKGAAKLLDVDLARCVNGKYLPEALR